jgi:hypothetical protein
MEAHGAAKKRKENRIPEILGQVTFCQEILGQETLGQKILGQETLGQNTFFQVTVDEIKAMRVPEKEEQ